VGSACCVCLCAAPPLRGPHAPARPDGLEIPGQYNNNTDRTWRVRAMDSRDRLRLGMLGRMRLALHHIEDLDRLRQRIAAERQALQRDRYRAVLLVAEDELEG